MTQQRSMAVVGAGVVGQVYAGRLAEAGHRVHLIARGATLTDLTREGVRLHRDGRTSTPDVDIVADPADLPGEVDVAYLAVRADQVESALPLLERVPARVVVTLVNLAGEARPVADRLGRERTILGFSGVGGTRGPDGVTYHEVKQQPTTIGRAGGREQAVVADLRGAGFTVDTVDDPVAWLATHAVFIAGIGAAILRSGDSTTLGRDRAATSQMVLAVRDGFQALSRLGTPVIPTPLKVIFTQVPRLISVPYWQRQLRGELGTLALEPHVLSTRDTEFRTLAEAARELTGWSPILDRHLASAGFSAERPR